MFLVYKALCKCLPLPSLSSHAIIFLLAGTCYPVQHCFRSVSVLDWAVFEGRERDLVIR